MSSRSLSAEFSRVEERAMHHDLNVYELVELLGSRGQALLILLLSLPFAQPVPLMGLSTPVGIVIAATAICLALGKNLWLPGKLAHRKIPKKTLISACHLFYRIWSRIERVVHPRGRFLKTFPALRVLNGLVVAVFGLLLALPLPVPFSNIFPAAVLILLSLGIAEEDGVLIVAGHGLALAILVALVLLVDQIRI
jgi:hypothetical protein